MAETRRRFVPALLAVPLLLAVGFVASIWPVYRLIDHELLPSGVIRPYAAVADALDGTAIGEA